MVDTSVFFRDLQCGFLQYLRSGSRRSQPEDHPMFRGLKVNIATSRPGGRLPHLSSFLFRTYLVPA